MIMKHLVFFFSLLANIFVFSQLATYDWRLHVSFTNPSEVATDGKTVLCAFRNGILEYDIEANETAIWSYTNYLSDVVISTVYYDQNSDSYWIGYENGNIDRVHKNSVVNIPYLKMASVLGTKKISSFSQRNGMVYAVSGLGILVINPEKNEIKETWYTNNNGDQNLKLEFLNDSVYTLTSKGIYKAYVNNPILVDYTQWHPITAMMITNDSLSYTKMIKWDQQLLLVKSNEKFGNDTLLKYTNGVLSYPLTGDNELKDVKVFDNKIYLVDPYGITEYDQTFTDIDRFYNYEFGYPLDMRTVIKVKEGEFYIADNSAGLVKFNGNWNNKRLTPAGPPSNEFYRVNARKDKLILSAGRVSKFGASYIGAQAYTFQDETWKHYSKFNQQMLDSINVWDLNGVAVHPKDENIMAISGCGEKYSLFIIKDNQQVSEMYGLENSVIENFLTLQDLTCISEVQYDSKGNLWMINTHTNDPLKVLTKDGVLYKFDTGGSTKQRFVEKLILDDDGNPWFSVPGIGIVGYFPNGTIDDASDDTYKILNKGDFTGALPNNDVTDIIKATDGKLWITTTEGFSILSNPSSVAAASYGNYNTYRPKIEFGENTEYFFGETYITCGTVDGGNRKWFGTANSGVFCLAADGYSIIHQFNTANSKLISNNILDMEFNPKTGELFVVTDVGLISLRTDASAGTETYDETIVFPNPVQPEYEGVVTIQGIKTDSDVKITDMAGNIVYETSSNGGTAVWNCKKVTGEKVATGVYLIWTAPKEGKGRKVGKVTVIR